MQQLRSVIYTVLLFLSTAFFAIVVILLMWLPPEAHYAVPRAWARTNLWLLKYVCGLDYQVEGRENLPQRPFISMWKHSSTWDTIAQMILVPRAAWLLKREILWIPLLGWAVARFKPIAIDRKAGASAVNQVVSQGKERLAAGMGVVIYPEGTRVAARRVAQVRHERRAAREPVRRTARARSRTTRESSGDGAVCSSGRA
jgi:1-acyl-sn-glycerol-3-phosphate acyltransferase